MKAAVIANFLPHVQLPRITSAIMLDIADRPVHRRRIWENRLKLRFSLIRRALFLLPHAVLESHKIYETDRLCIASAEELDDLANEYFEMAPSPPTSDSESPTATRPHTPILEIHTNPQSTNMYHPASQTPYQISHISSPSVDANTDHPKDGDYLPEYVDVDGNVSMTFKQWPVGY